MTAEELIHELPKGLLKWYTFKRGGRALCVMSDTDFDNALAETLEESGLVTERRSREELEGLEEAGYDTAVVGDALSLAGAQGAEHLLGRVFHVLGPDGVLFVCTGNRFGIRYFCGDKDPYTGGSFDGIEGYNRIGAPGQRQAGGRLYSRAELEGMLQGAGFVHQRFYSVFPDPACPQLLVAGDHEPQEELKIRIFPYYNDPDTVFMEEENLYTPLVRNGMLHAMAGGYVAECPVNGRFSEAAQITVSMERGHGNALSTIIRRDGKVEKRPAYEDYGAKAKSLVENARYLKAHGIGMIEGEEKEGAYVMPYVEGVPLAKHFRRLAEEDREEFYRQFDGLWELIRLSSEHVDYEAVDWEHFDPWWDEAGEEAGIDRGRYRRAALEEEGGALRLGPVLERGYMDLVLINGLATQKGPVFYDQETYVPQLPAKAIMLRNIDFLYHGDARMHRILPREELLERYGMGGCLDIFYARIGHFLTKLRHDDILSGYHQAHRRRQEALEANRRRMNFSEQDYRRLFIEVFENLEGRKLYLFGAGRYAGKFLAMYGSMYEVAGIVDNDEAKWGSTLSGTAVLPPAALSGLEAGTFKVIICMKRYMGALRQLREMGVRSIGIYDTETEYRPVRRSVQGQPAGDTGGRERERGHRKYHVGYVAGVFDLFHMGHLNLLRRAREQCDHLIVGVVTDEGVRRDKHTEPFIPFKERLAIVAACRYVDEAVEIPFEYCDTQDAYRRFGFDVQFSGSDYAHDPVWAGKREFLREHGSDMVFFPYTESTSSTRIKGLIEKRMAQET